MVDHLTPQQEKALALALKDHVVEPLAQLTAQLKTSNTKHERLIDRLIDKQCELLTDLNRMNAEINRLRGVMMRNGFGALAFPTYANSNTSKSKRTAHSVDLSTQRMRPASFQKTSRE
jgi:hypothetical protein